MRWGMKAKKTTQKTILYIIVILMVIFYIFPFYWAIKSSFTSDKFLFTKDIKFWPQGITF